MDYFLAWLISGFVESLLVIWQPDHSDNTTANSPPIVIVVEVKKKKVCKTTTSISLDASRRILFLPFAPV